MGNVVVTAIFAANRYMTLATADASGRPWASPVWFATEDHEELFWVSDPQTRHSRNIAARPEVAIVVFDSQVPVGDAAAVYMEAVAQELSGDELDRGIEVFSRRSVAQRLPDWSRDDVVEPARFRLYRATVTERSILGPHDERLPVTM
jgi:nitroimidazol reductase NimA-like FMN-containing flavoprotein (pyridoxamine 5'-phosphate oxidase superfamily)